MISKVYKRKRKRKGKVVYAKTYTHRYCMPWMDKPRDRALDVSDKRVAEKLAAEHIRQLEYEHSGISLPPAQVAASNTPLLDLLAEYVADLKATGKTRQYVWDVQNRIGRLAKECNWRKLRHVSAVSFEHWRSCGPRSLKTDQLLAPKTINDYLASARSFMMWLFRGDKLPNNPLALVQMVATAGRESFARRSLTPEEGQRLVAHAGERAVLYMTALLTAYRRNTLYRLAWADIDIDGELPMIRPAVSTIKNREEHPMPLRDDLRDALAALRPSDFKPTDRVFAGLLVLRGLHDLKIDLAAAGIEFETPRGRMDFHSLRHTASTWAGMTGEAGAVLKRFTGHKTDSQLARYVHPDQQPVKRILDQLPQFDGPRIGTRIVATEPDSERPGETRRDTDKARNAYPAKQKRRTGRRQSGLQKMGDTGLEPVTSRV